MEKNCFMEKNCMSACSMGNFGARGRKRKFEADGGTGGSASQGAASVVMAGSWLTQGKKMCSRNELIVSNSGDGHMKLVLASDLAQILEEKNLMLVATAKISR
jgi:hypothetical protein